MNHQYHRLIMHHLYHHQQRLYGRVRSKCSMKILDELLMVCLCVYVYGFMFIQGVFAARINANGFLCLCGGFMCLCGFFYVFM